MFNKIDFSNPVWMELEADETPELLQDFFENADTDSDEFYDLMDNLIEASVCKPAMYLAIPHLIEFALSLDFEDAVDLWCYIGIFLADALDYRNIVPVQVIEVYDQALHYAQEVYPQLIVNNRSQLAEHGHELLATLFGIVQHPFCKIISDNFYANDLVGESLVFCTNQHENDVIIYSDSSIAPITQYKKKYKITPIPMACEPLNVACTNPNPWKCFAAPLEDFLLSDIQISSEVKSHIQTTISIVKKGVDSNLPMKFVFSIMGSLLYWGGMEEFAFRSFHAWDMVRCTRCENEFCFADQWGK